MCRFRSYLQINIAGDNWGVKAIVVAYVYKCGVVIFWIIVLIVEKKLADKFGDRGAEVGVERGLASFLSLVKSYERGFRSLSCSLIVLVLLQSSLIKVSICWKYGR